MACITFIQGCAVHSDLFKDTNKRLTYLNTSNSYRSFYSIANVGAYKKGPDKEFLEALKESLSLKSKDGDFLLFLGDNIHSSNLKTPQNEETLTLQLDLSTKFKGQTLFLTGEQEWNEYGVEGLEKIETYIEDYYQEEDHFLPKNGCPLEVIDVSDDIEVMLINSQWYIEDWSKVAGINDKCQIKTREQFKALLSSEMRKARHKTILIAMHHPLYTNGVYGGEIPAEVVYRPTTENVFIPVAGTFWSFLRSQGGLSKQDRYNPLMNELMEIIELAAFEAPNVIVLSGHERSLQYIDHKSIKQVISGTGSSVKPARLGKRGLFTSTKPGISETRIYKDGSSSVHFYTFNGTEFTEIYNKQAFPKPKEYNIDSLSSSFPKTKIASVYPAESVVKSAKYEKFWGKHYRYVYGVPVEAPVAILDTLYGGLKVERAGGGNQTLSLRLVTKDDKEFNMRAIAKDPIAFLKSAGYNDLNADDYFEGTVPATIIEDFYTAAHPYGAFAIPRLAGSIKINHTHPKLYFVPKQKALGEFNETHGNLLYMIVEKPDGDFSNSHMFSNSKEVESTPDLFEEIREDEQNKLDERVYIRARIFDMLIGDWDRHEDQWRWAQSQIDEKDGITNYIAVPRDRDQVFANFDGSFLERLQKFMSGTRQFGKYGPNIPYIEQFSRSAINLDRALVQRSDWSVWEEEIKFIQDRITPEVVSKAFSEAPKEIQDDIWKGIQDDLLSRKRNLNDIVTRYYDHFMTFQTLKGTDKDDHFVITNTPEGGVHVTAHRIKDGEKGTLLFDRYFSPSQTKDLWIYGLDDKDIFEVQATKSSPIKVVITGGLDEDTFIVNGGNNVTIYDQKSYKNEIKKKGNASYHIDDIYENHIYDTERMPGGGSGFGLELSYNPDTGVTPHLNVSKKTKGFEGNPFTTKTDISVQYFSLTQAADARMAWHRGHLFKDWNFQANARATTANYTQNFFGLGNESENRSNSFDANRIVMQHFSGGIGTYYNGEYGTAAAIQLLAEHYDLGDKLREPDLITSTDYFTVDATYAYHSIDDVLFPTRGMNFTVNGEFSDELNSTATVGILDPSITFWNAIDTSRNLIFKTSVKGQIRFGESIPFYKLANIGADNGLRSYRQSRFTGKQSLTGSIDLAYKFKPLRTALFPLRMQGYLGYDTGRVWITEEKSKQLHYSYGGGVKLSTAAVVNASINYFTGPEGGRLGFAFSMGL
ncbi:calcineurin-like phosphoesterase family protein [Dokdonia sp. Hel_I_53]|nr:calcineurin-like phosphoesterase family protein [Dokdonia sp. Hel_I_53]